MDFKFKSGDGFFSFSSQSEGGVLDVKVNFFSNVDDFLISPEPEVLGFLVDVLPNGNSDEFNLNSGFFFEFVGDEDGLLSDLFSLGFVLEILIELEFDDQFTWNLSDSLDFACNLKVPFGLKFDNDADIVSVKSFNSHVIVSL